MFLCPESFGNLTYKGKGKWKKKSPSTICKLAKCFETRTGFNFETSRFFLHKYFIKSGNKD